MLEVVTGVETPDETLVLLARNGDDSAREELFRRYRSDAYRYAYRQLGHEQDALDVVQESMLKAFSGLDEFTGRSAFRTWLLRIVINTAFDWGRRRKRRPGDQGGNDGDLVRFETATYDDPARRLHREDLRIALDHALDRLSHTIRSTFVLFAELGLSYREISETQDVPIGTVMSRIHAAREKLQAELDWDNCRVSDELEEGYTMIRCEDVIQELAAPTDTPDQAALANHVSRCTSCAAWVKRANQLDRLWEATRSSEPAPERWESLWPQIAHGLDRPVSHEVGPTVTQASRNGSTIYSLVKFDVKLLGRSHTPTLRTRLWAAIGIVGLSQAAAVLLIAGLTWWFVAPPKHGLYLVEFQGLTASVDHSVFQRGYRRGPLGCHSCRSK